MGLFANFDKERQYKIHSGLSIAWIFTYLIQNCWIVDEPTEMLEYLHTYCESTSFSKLRNLCNEETYE